MSMSNEFRAVGRLTKDPKVFDNKDGSKKVYLTIAVANNYKNADGKRDSQYIPVEAFLNKTSVEKNGLGIYGNLHTGDQVMVRCELRNNNYPDPSDKSKTIYGLTVLAQEILTLEPKTTRDNRVIARAAEGASVVAEAADATIGMDDNAPLS